MRREKEDLPLQKKRLKRYANNLKERIYQAGYKIGEVADELQIPRSVPPADGKGSLVQWLVLLVVALRLALGKFEGLL